MFEALQQKFVNIVIKNMFYLHSDLPTTAVTLRCQCGCGVDQERKKKWNKNAKQTLRNMLID